jgi:hypothetical protein
MNSQSAQHLAGVLFGAVAAPCVILFSILLWRRRLLHPIRGRHARLLLLSNVLVVIQLIDSAVWLASSGPFGDVRQESAAFVFPCLAFASLFNITLTFQLAILLLRAQTLLFSFAITSDVLTMRKQAELVAAGQARVSGFRPNFYTARRHWIAPTFVKRVLATVGLIYLVAHGALSPLAKWPNNW